MTELKEGTIDAIRFTKEQFLDLIITANRNKLNKITWIPKYKNFIAREFI